MVAVGLRPSRLSHQLITETGEFGLNIPTSEQVTAMDFCGIVSGRDYDKFAECGFTPAPASKLKFAPLIAECPVSLECKVRQVVSLGSHDLFIAEIVAVSAEESCIGQNRIDPLAVKPVSYAGGTYFGLGEMVARGGVGKQMKTK